MYKSFGWIRMHDEKEHAEDLLKGKLYFNTIAYHRKRGNDPLEGIVRREVDIDLSTSDGEHGLELKNAPGYFKAEIVNIKYTPVFCMTAIGGEIEKDTYGNSVNLAKQFRLSRKCEAEYGNHAVIIYNPTEFIQRCLESARNHPVGLGHDWVKYVRPRGPLDTSMLSPAILFNKRDKFKYENEYRLVAFRYTQDEGHFELNVGDLTDIAFYCRTNEINRNFRIVPNQGAVGTHRVQIRKP